MITFVLEWYETKPWKRFTVHPDQPTRIREMSCFDISFSRVSSPKKAVIIPEWLTTLGGNSFSYAGSLVIHNWKGTVTGTWVCELFVTYTGNVATRTEKLGQHRPKLMIHRKVDHLPLTYSDWSNLDESWMINDKLRIENFACEWPSFRVLEVGLNGLRLPGGSMQIWLSFKDRQHNL